MILIFCWLTYSYDKSKNAIARRLVVRDLEFEFLSQWFKSINGKVELEILVNFIVIKFVDKKLISEN